MSQPAAARAIEAILMVAQEPVDPHLLAQLLEISPVIVEELCQQLRAAYEADDRGFVLAKVAGGYRFQSHGDLAAYVERFVLEGQSARLSSAALETLAIVAYKQPISRAQVAAIRGVNVDGVLRTLQQRGYVEEVGRDPGPGQATLFGTSREFLERLGLDSLADLPPIADLFPSTDIMEALERGLRAERPEPLPLDQAPAGAAPDPAPATTATTGRDDVVDHGQVAAPRADGPAPEAEGPAPATPAAPHHRDDVVDHGDVVAADPAPSDSTAATAFDDVDLDLDPDDDLAPPAWALDEPDPAPADDVVADDVAAGQPAAAGTPGAADERAPSSAPAPEPAEGDGDDASAR